MIREGIRLWNRSRERKRDGPQEFRGNAKQICKSIVDTCWNGTFFINSLGNYRSFWARDFGLCVDSLLKLKQKERVIKTLSWAIQQYAQAGKITTTILPNKQCFSFPNLYSPDSVAFFFYALHAANAKNIIEKYRSFLQTELDHFFTLVQDPGTDLVRQHTQFSGMRDYAVRNSSCYDNTMLIWLSRIARKLKFDAPRIDSKQLIAHYWMGDYFRDDLTSNHCTADANIFPFWTGIVQNKTMCKKALSSLHKSCLDNPLSLKYTAVTHERMLWTEIFVPGWERTAIWTNIGFLYLHLLATTDKKTAKVMFEKWAKTIENHGTVYECYDGKEPYTSFFYLADEGMLWSANFATLPFPLRST